MSQTSLLGQLDDYEIDFPWEHPVSRIEADDAGFYWFHDDKDFYYYNGHQVVPTDLGKRLDKKKFDYFFSGDIISIKDAMMFINEQDISLYNPKKGTITRIWTLPEGDMFNHMYRDDLGQVWLFNTNPDQDTRPVYRAEDGLNFELAFDLKKHIGDRVIQWDYELTDRNGLMFFHRRLGGLKIIDDEGNEVQAPVQNLSDFEAKRDCSQFRLDNQNNLWRIYNDEFSILDWKTGSFRDHGLTGQLEFITDCKKVLETTNLQRGLKGFGSLLNLRTIYTDSKDRIWMSCAAAYLVMYDPQTDVIIGFRKPIVSRLEGGDHDMQFVFEDAQENIWGVQKGGVFKIRDKEPFFKSYVVNTGDSDHAVYRGEDQATIKKSINHYNDYAIRNSAIHGIGEDSEGKVIFQEGVFSYQLDLLSEKVKVLPLFNPTEKVHLTVEGDLKIYCSWNSYYKMDEHYNANKLDFPIIKIETIFRQSDGDIWLGGISAQRDYHFGLLNPNTLEYEGNYIDQSGEIDFRQISVKSIDEDDEGVLWLATNQGVISIDKKNGKFEKKTHTFLLEGSEYVIGHGVNQFIHHKDDLFWFKSDYEFGLVDIKTKELIYLNQIDSEESGKDLKILPIDDHTLWVGDQRGVRYIDITDNTNVVLSLEEGIDTKGAVNVMRQLASGLIAIGTNNGLYTFNPEYILAKTKIRENKDLNVPLYVNAYSYLDAETEERIGHQFLASKDLKIELDHNYRDLQITVSLKSFDHPDRHNYSYQLEGYDPNWSTPSKNNVINYTGLPPGDYNLRVRGSVSGGLWSSELLNIAISVTDIWYRSWWFIGLLILSISMLVYLITRYFQGQKLKQQIAISEVRSRISKDLHDDVGTILSGVANQTELLEAIVDDKAKTLAHQIAVRSREAMGRMRDTVWAMDSRRDGIEDLKFRMFDFLGESILEDRIKYTFKEEIQDSTLILLPNTRQAAYLIFKESIANIIKHSDTTRMDIVLKTNDSQLILKITDYGSEQERIKTSGQGLINMKSRAETNGGIYSFKYDNGYQTSVVLPTTSV